MSDGEYMSVAWTVLRMHCVVAKNAPGVKIKSDVKNPRVFTDCIDDKLLKWAPPLTGEVYSRESGRAVDA